jgi:DNA invertase Pin-like site-specific DNA recombinase
MKFFRPGHWLALDKARRALAEKLGWSLGRRGGAKAQPRILELREKGARRWEIARELGVHRGTVRKCLRLRTEGSGAGMGVNEQG